MGRSESGGGSHRKLTRRRLLWQSAATIAASGVLGWHAGAPREGVTEAAPRRGGRLIVGLLVAANHLDPHRVPNQPGRWIDQMIYSNLVEWDSQMRIKGDLAESWDTPNDRTYVFRLRRGAMFHNGREVVSADVQYSIQRIMDPATHSLYGTTFDVIDRIDTPDKYTVVFRLKRPFAPLLAKLADPPVAVVPREFVEANHGDLRGTALGSGPFKLAEYVPGDHVLLVRNPNYYMSGLPRVDELLFRAMPDESARHAALRAGDIDVSTFVLTSYVAQLRNAPGVTVVGGDSGNFYYVMLNMRPDKGFAPGRDPKVRQALAWATDRDEIVKVALFGEGYPLLGPIPPYHWAALRSPVIGTDIGRAKRLMAESGYPHGFPVKITASGERKSNLDTLLLLKQEWSPLRVEVTVAPEEASVFYGEMGTSNFQALVEGFGGNADPDDFLYERFHSNGRTNYMGYSNPQVDALLDAGRTTLDRNKRVAIYQRAQELIVRDAPQVMLFSMKQYEGIRTRVKGFFHQPTMNLLGLKYAWIAG